MTALVTGATGFLGGAFVARLLAHGTSRVRCLVRPGSRTAVLERLAVGHDRLLLVRGSLASPDVALAALDDADVVYHLAAGTGGAAADLFLNTVVASKNLLEAVLHRQHPARVVLVSSFGVYGTAGLARGALVDEDTPFETNPERRDLYVKRSPLHHLEGLDRPVIFFQGLDDKVVPPNQAEMLFEALRKRGVPTAYVPFEGEQHGFRKAENIQRALEGELYFFARVFGFTPADPIPPVPIENL